MDSNMIIFIHSDVSYLSEKQVRIRSRGYLYIVSTEYEYTPLKDDILESSILTENTM